MKIWMRQLISYFLIGYSLNLSCSAETEIDDLFKLSLEELGDIKVTSNARMRGENIQQIPIGISHYSAKTIQDAKIDRMETLTQMMPNMSLSKSQSLGTSFLTIRGISQVRNSEPPIATVIDDVLQVNSRQFTRELYDIEAIEVLRGPQSALYGRNAIGGAILITTAQPTNEWESHWRFGYGQGNEYLTQATVSGALIDDKLLLRLSGRYLEREGYFNNSFLNKKVDFKEDLSFKGQLTWLASERLKVDLRFALNRAKSGAFNFNYQPAIIGTDGITLDSNLTFPFDSTKEDANNVSRNFIANNLGKNEREIDEVSLKIEYDADFATLTSITSWNRIEEFLSGDQFPYSAGLTQNFLNGSLTVDGGQTQFVDINAFSQEFRITSNADNNFRWMLGAYLLMTERFISSTTSDDRGLGILRVEDKPLTDIRNPTLSFFGDDNNNTAWAAFANFAYDITEDLEASIAMRYDSDRRRQTVSPYNNHGQAGAVNKKTFAQFQPQFSLRYQLLPEISLYGSWGIGFRSGQFNQTGVSHAALINGVQGINNISKQEKTENFELGFKSAWFNKQMQVNGSIFFTEQSNRPYFVFVGAVGAQVLVNIDEVEIFGGELEINNHWMEGLDSYVSLGYSSSNIKEYTLNPSLVGNYAPYIPEYTINAGLQYRTPLTPWFGFLGRVDFEHRGKQFWAPENNTARSAINLVNLKVGLEDPKNNWSLMFMLDNVTNEKYNSEWVAGGFAHPALPRSWHIDLQFSF